MGHLRIASWNVNSIRTRYPLVVDWLRAVEPDVACLQETKCTDADFPTEVFTELGYEVAHWGANQWNGVAILSRVGLADVQRGFVGPQREPFDEPRIIAATCDGVRVISVYVPNGRELGDPHYAFKLVWLERLRHEFLNRPDLAAATIIAGDFNVAPASIDIYDPARWRRRTHASPPERHGFASLLDAGLRDVFRERCADPGLYTWWNYRVGAYQANQGLRIDLMLVSTELAARVSDTTVDTPWREAEKPSDHAPVRLDLAPVP